MKLGGVSLSRAAIVDAIGGKTQVNKLNSL